MLIRFMGAFFVRRNSGDPLYRRVLERYIHMATKEGVCQAVFLEGRLSRDGKLQQPKLGLMDYMLRGFDPKIDRDIVFIPVGINYDRTIEDRSLLRALDPSLEKRSMWFVAKTTSSFIIHSLVLMMLGRWRRYGYACVNFGAPVSVNAYCHEQNVVFSALERDARFPEIEKLCHRLMASISEVVPVLPLSLVSAVFLRSMDTGLDILDVEKRSNELIAELQARGAPILETSRTTRAHAIADAVDLMMLRGFVTANGNHFKAVREEEPILRYYANTIEHWLE
jgi:glycerol-3-phosphate O-acyltransferase